MENVYVIDINYGVCEELTEEEAIKETNEILLDGKARGVEGVDKYPSSVSSADEVIKVRSKMFLEGDMSNFIVEAPSERKTNELIFDLEENNSSAILINPEDGEANEMDFASLEEMADLNGDESLAEMIREVNGRFEDGEGTVFFACEPSGD